MMFALSTLPATLNSSRSFSSPILKDKLPTKTLVAMMSDVTILRASGTESERIGLLRKGQHGSRA